MAESMFGVALFGGRVSPLVPRDIPYFPQGVCPVAHGLRFAVRVQLLDPRPAEQLQESRNIRKLRQSADDHRFRFQK